MMKTLRALAVAVVVAALLTPCLAAPQKKPAPRKPAPQKTPDILGLLAKEKDASTFLKLVKAAGLDATLRQRGPYTVLVPTNAAFAKLPKGTVARWLKPANKAALRSVLLYHIVKGRFVGKDVLMRKPPISLTTLNGAKVIVTRVAFQVYVNKIKVPRGDAKASNGVVHGLDGVLIPPRRK